MACGVPVIGSAAGGLPEVVEDGVTGYLRPVGDVEGMSAAALSLLRDPEKWAAFSTSGAPPVRREVPDRGDRREIPVPLRGDASARESRRPPADGPRSG